jgi:hypothetical protein
VKIGQLNLTELTSFKPTRGDTVYCALKTGERNQQAPSEAKTAGCSYRLSEKRGLLRHSPASVSEKGRQMSKNDGFSPLPEIIKKKGFRRKPDNCF